MVVAASLVILFSPHVPSEQGIRHLDKAVHAVLFAALALATLRRFGRGLVVVLLYALVSEVLQTVLPIHRDGGMRDALADVVGAFAGWLVAWTPDRVRNAAADRR